ncbi:MAG: DUF1059 domain-containing protein [Methanotrichaceae archaeon]
MAEESYREYMCRETTNDKTCGFKVQAKTEEEVMQHAKLHAENTHGMSEMPGETESKIKKNIRPIKVEIK